MASSASPSTSGSSAPLRLARTADPDEGLALRYYDVTSGDGTRLRAWTNDVEGPTVLLCNGLGTNPYAWPALLDPDCGVRVISWNHRGVGGSARPVDRDRVGIDAFAEDAVAVLDDAGVDACVAMGWSMGVNTMFELAVLHPERLTGMLAVGGVPGDTFASMGAPLRIPRVLRKPLTVNVARTLKIAGRAISAVASQLEVGPTSLEVLVRSGFMHRPADPALARRAVKEFLTTPTQWYMHLALHSSLHGRVSLRDIAVPTAFVAGTHDILASAHDMRTAAIRIEGATYSLLRASHFLPMEKPEEIHALLLDVIERADQA